MRWRVASDPVATCKGFLGFIARPRAEMVLLSLILFRALSSFRFGLLL